MLSAALAEVAEPHQRASEPYRPDVTGERWKRLFAHLAKIDARLTRIERSLSAPQPVNEPVLIDASAVAQRYSVSRDWVYEHATELGAQRLGNGKRPRLRFDPERVAAFMGAGRRRDPADRSQAQPTRKPPRRQAPAAPLLEIKGGRP